MIRIAKHVRHVTWFYLIIIIAKYVRIAAFKFLDMLELFDFTWLLELLNMLEFLLLNC
jgi:hypothetical protein